MSTTLEKPFFINMEWLFLRCVLCLVGGVLLWFYPDLLAKSVVIGTGILLMVSGIITLVMSYTSNRENNYFYFVAAAAILAIIAGLAFVIASAFFAKWFVFIIGILVIVLAVIQTIELINIRRQSPETSILSFFNPILLLILGVLVIINPHRITNLIGYFAAAALVYYAIVGFILAFRIKRLNKKIKEQLTEWEEPDVVDTVANHDEEVY